MWGHRFNPPIWIDPYFWFNPCVWVYYWRIWSAEKNPSSRPLWDIVWSIITSLHCFVVPVQNTIKLFQIYLWKQGHVSCSQSTWYDMGWQCTNSYTNYIPLIPMKIKHILICDCKCSLFIEIRYYEYTLCYFTLS